MKHTGPLAEWWTAQEIADYIGTSVHTVRAYAGRGHMPAPDGRIGNVRVWRPDTIKRWHARRIGVVGRWSTCNAA